MNGRSDNSCSFPCSCKFGYLGPACDQCVDRYYGFPNCKRKLITLSLKNNYNKIHRKFFKHATVTVRELKISIATANPVSAYADRVTQVYAVISATMATLVIAYAVCATVIMAQQAKCAGEQTALVFAARITPARGATSARLVSTIFLAVYVKIFYTWFEIKVVEK